MLLFVILVMLVVGVCVFVVLLWGLVYAVCFAFGLAWFCDLFGLRCLFGCFWFRLDLRLRIDSRFVFDLRFAWMILCLFVVLGFVLGLGCTLIVFVFWCLFVGFECFWLL